MKRIAGVTILMITALMLVLSGCGNSAADAQTAFDGIMDALKSCNAERIDEYYDFDRLAGFIDEADGRECRDAILATLGDMEYKVNSAEKLDSGAVRLNVEITTVDFSAITDSYIEKVIALVATPDYQKKVKTMTESEYKSAMARQMISAVNERDGSKTTQTIDVTMTQSGGGWKLGGDSDEFLGALFANLSDAVISLT